MIYKGNFILNRVLFCFCNLRIEFRREGSVRGSPMVVLGMGGKCLAVGCKWAGSAWRLVVNGREVLGASMVTRPRNRDPAQPRNRATAIPRNRDPAQPRSGIDEAKKNPALWPGP